MKFIALVREFNEALGCGALARPGQPEAGVRLVRAQLMLEETAEVTKAAAAGDLYEVLLELSDLQYVVDGAFTIYGADRSGANIPHWETDCAGPPMLMPTEDAMLMHITGITRSISEITACMIGGGDWQNVATTILQLRGQLSTLWSALCVPEELRWDMFQALHEANMKKLGGGLSAAGRVMKPAGWQPADQRAVLANHGLMIPPGGRYALPVANQGASA